MHTRVLVLIVVALVGVTTAVAAAAARTKYGILTAAWCGQARYLGHGAEWWHYQLVAARRGWRKANAHGQKHPARYRTYGCPASEFQGHGPEWWHHRLVALSARARRHTGTRGHRVVRIAERYIGVPYLWGGTTPHGFDCSGFVRYVFARIGVHLPRVTWSQMRVGRHVSSPRPGDALFFFGGEHVGIYIGGGRFIDAPHTGANVGVRRVAAYGSYTARRYA